MFIVARCQQVQSQDELICELSRQLREARQEKATLQAEFNQYRKHSQVCNVAHEVAHEQYTSSLYCVFAYTGSVY